MSHERMEGLKERKENVSKLNILIVSKLSVHRIIFCKPFFKTWLQSAVSEFDTKFLMPAISTKGVIGYWVAFLPQGQIPCLLGLSLLLICRVQ